MAVTGRQKCLKLLPFDFHSEPGGTTPPAISEFIPFHIAHVLGMKDYESDMAAIGSWTVKNPCGTVYIEGEIGRNDVVKRFDSFEYRGKQRDSMKVLIKSLSIYQYKTDDSFILSERKNQKELIKWQ